MIQMSLTAASVCRCAALLAFFACGRAFAVPTGDRWETVRGDLSPGVGYSAAARTSSGRLIAVGNSGQMMLSDDGGVHWTFRQMRAGPVAVGGWLTDIVEFSPGAGAHRIAAVSSDLAILTGADVPYAARTHIYLSDDDGETWSAHDFPYVSADFGATTLPGVNVNHLHVSTAGQLLAYGTTSFSFDLDIIWSFGGLIYRSTDGINWQQAHFAEGPLARMTDAGGRTIAVGMETAVDSADGSAWNGYLFDDDATISLPGGGRLDAVTVRRLRLYDVAYRSGQYVAAAVTYVPYDDTGTIDSSTVDRRFTLTSANPFTAARQWVAYEQPATYGRFADSTTALLGIGYGVFGSSDVGHTWQSIDASVEAPGGAIVNDAANAVIAVGSSEAVWKSVTGADWTQVWNREIGPDLYPVGGTEAVQLAIGYTNQGRTLFYSTTNGETWEEAGGDTSVFGHVVVRGTRMLMPSGDRRYVRISDDAGRTWQTRNVTSEGGDDVVLATALAVTPAGRLILAAEGIDFGNHGLFYISDDGGETWSPRATTTGWHQTPAVIVAAGGGRIIAGVNDDYRASKLIVSDDNGETWRTDSQLESLPGLAPDSSDIHHTAIVFLRMERAASGRLILLGTDAIVTSDNNGTTWTVRAASWNVFPYGHGGLFDVELLDLAFAGGRWLVAADGGYGGFASPSRGVLASDDGGTSWRQIAIATRQNTTHVLGVVAGSNGRAIVTGTNAAVYVSDGPLPPAPQPRPLHVRAGETFSVTVPRPALPGVVDVRYSAVQGDAVAGIDYVPSAGVLTWVAGDENAKSFSVGTIDTGIAGPDKTLKLQIVSETDAIRGASELPAVIENVRSGTRAAIVVVDGTELYLGDDGEPASFGIALNKAPSASVRIALGNSSPDIAAVSPAVLTFGPGDWMRAQRVTLTPATASRPASTAGNGDAHAISLTITSADPDYQGLDIARVWYARPRGDALFANGFD